MFPQGGKYNHLFRQSLFYGLESKYNFYPHSLFLHTLYERPRDHNRTLPYGRQPPITEIESENPEDIEFYEFAGQNFRLVAK